MVELVEDELKRYVGIIVTTRDQYGFIECDDFAKHIFYHISQCSNPEDIMTVGATVSFTLIDGRPGEKQAADVKIELG